MSFVPINPRPFLQDLVNKDVVVRLKWGETEYKGRLVVRHPTYLPYTYPPPF
jgi:small nuclear ribonucleoprotein F